MSSPHEDDSFSRLDLLEYERTAEEKRELLQIAKTWVFYDHSSVNHEKVLATTFVLAMKHGTKYYTIKKALEGQECLGRPLAKEEKLMVEKVLQHRAKLNNAQMARQRQAERAKLERRNTGTSEKNGEENNVGHASSPRHDHETVGAQSLRAIAGDINNVVGLHHRKDSIGSSSSFSSCPDSLPSAAASAIGVPRSGNPLTRISDRRQSLGTDTFVNNCPSRQCNGSVQEKVGFATLVTDMDDTDFILDRTRSMLEEGLKYMTIRSNLEKELQRNLTEDEKVAFEFCPGYDSTVLLFFQAPLFARPCLPYITEQSNYKRKVLIRSLIATFMTAKEGRDLTTQEKHVNTSSPHTLPTSSPSLMLAPTHGEFFPSLPSKEEGEGRK
jgi:hypothetical protein